MLSPAAVRLLVPLVLGAACLSLAGACRRAGPPPGGAVAQPSEQAEISLESVRGYSEPSAQSAEAVTLPRGTRVVVRAAQDGFYGVKLSAGGEAWVPAGSFERVSDKEAREARAKAVAGFPPQPGRAVEPCPVFLAPDYGGARWGELESGDDVQVVLADHDFYGIRSAVPLAFVPARCIRLLPSEISPAPDAPAAPKGSKRELIPSILSDEPPEPEALPGGDGELPPPSGPAMPADVQPQAVSRPDPEYPPLARLRRIGGVVILDVLVEVDGTVGGIEVVQGAPAGLTEAAASAVRRWRFRPGLLGGRPVPARASVKVTFDPDR